MRLLTIPDLHGKTAWQRVNAADYDKIIFLGDYVDDHGEHTDDQLFNNLLAILAFRQAHPDKVVLLLGNHDVHYLHYPHYRASRFRESMQERLQELFTRERAAFRVAYGVGDYLFTHAGVAAFWWEWVQERALSLSHTEHLPLADRLNALMDSPDRRYLYGAGFARQGPYPCGGVVWADFSETHADPLPHYHQVVGHSPQFRIRTFGDAKTSITYTDVLTNRVQFWEADV